MNTKVKSGKRQGHGIEYLIDRLHNQDKRSGNLVMYRHLFSGCKKTVYLENIIDIIKTVNDYHVPSKSYLKSLAAKLKLYNITLTHKPESKIQNNDVYMPKGYKANGKPITIYSKAHLPMVIDKVNCYGN